MITLQYFPTAVVKILTTDAENHPLADAFFNITDTSGNVIFKNLRSNSQGYCFVPLQLNSGDGMTDLVYLDSAKLINSSKLLHLPDIRVASTALLLLISARIRMHT